MRVYTASSSSVRRAAWVVTLVAIVAACGGSAGSPSSADVAGGADVASDSGSGSDSDSSDDGGTESPQSPEDADLIPSVTLPPAEIPPVKVELEPADLCDLLTEEEVTQIMGRAMSPRPYEPLSRCEWLTPGYQQGDGGLYIGQLPGIGFFESFLNQPGVEHVVGPWEDAVYWREPLGQIDFIVFGGEQSMSFSITGVRIQQEGDFRDEIVRIATLVYERIPSVDLAARINAPEPDPSAVIGSVRPSPYVEHPVWWRDVHGDAEGLIDPITGESTPLQVDAERRMDPAWSPDASTVAMTSFESGDAGIVSASLHLGPASFEGPWETFVLPTSDLPADAVNATIANPVWSVDGRIYFLTGFYVGDERRSEVWAFDPESRMMSRVQTTDALVTTVVASPDGSRLIVAADYRASFMDPVSGVVSDPIPGFGLFATVTSWSPDGTRLALQIDGDIWTAALDGSDMRQLTNTPDVSESDPAFSADGGFIVYSSNAVGGEYDFQAWAMNADGSSPRSLTSGRSVASGY